jgi:hypothetical protein
MSVAPLDSIIGAKHHSAVYQEISMNVLNTRSFGETKMPRIIIIIVFMISSISFGNDEDAAAKDSRIYQTDSIGTINPNKPSLVIQEDGRILPADSIGTKIDGSRDQYKIIGDRIYETDSLGTAKHDKSQRIK